MLQAGYFKRYHGIIPAFTFMDGKMPVEHSSPGSNR